MNRKIYILAAVLVLVSMALSSCGGAVTPTSAPVAPAATQPPATTAPAAIKSITLGFSQEPDNVIPSFSAMTYAVYVSQMTMAALGMWDDKNNFVPELATEVPTAANGGVSPDGLTITWHLKPDLKWSDGQPLTSADVKFTWQALTDKANTVVAMNGLDQVASVDTPDATTVVLHFTTLFAPWYTIFTQWGNGGTPILPQHILQGHTGLEKDPYIHMPTVTSGAWTISEWVAGDHMTLLPNPNFVLGKPKLDRIYIKFLPDPETTLAGMKNGDIDMSPDFTESDIPTITALEPAIHLDVKPGNFFDHYFFNLGITNSTVKDASGKVIGNSDTPGFCPFQNVNVRKAIALGIDRFSIVKNLLYGKTTVPGDLWINSPWDANLQPYPYDPTQAAQLLDAAGYKVGSDGIRHGLCNGVDTRLSIDFQTTTKEIRKQMALAAQSDLAKIGIEFKPTHLTSTVFFGSYTDNGPLALGKYDMGDYATGFYPDPYPSTQDFLCEAVPTKDAPGGQNFYHICDPQLEQMFADSIKSADPTVRLPIYQKIQQYMYDNYLIIPIYAWSNMAAYSDRLVMGPWGSYGTWFWNTEVWDVKN